MTLQVAACCVFFSMYFFFFFENRIRGVLVYWNASAYMPCYMHGETKMSTGTVNSAVARVPRNREPVTSSAQRLSKVTHDTTGD